ncbi:MAG: hypothetical protein RIK87_05240 [Fuerstiella sp.]
MSCHLKSSGSQRKPSSCIGGLLRALIPLTLSLIPLSADEPRWVQHRHVGSLEIFSESPENLSAVLEELQGVTAEFQNLLGFSTADRTVQLIIFRSHQSYRSYLAERIPQALGRRAIFFRNGDRYQIFAFRHADLLTDLRHEYTHALLHQQLPYIPLWIDEGLAEFLEDRPDQRSRSSRLAGMKWRCRSGWHPSLEKLEAMDSAAGMTSAQYRDSWAWVHFLINDSDATRQLLKDYVQAISAGEAPGPFSEWASRRDPLVLKRVGSYFRRFRISLR